MTILFERTGGFMGTKISLNLNLDELLADQSATLKRLVDESDFFGIDDIPVKTSRPDEFHYIISISTELIKHTIHAGDASCPETLRPLLKELLTYTRKPR